MTNYNYNRLSEIITNRFINALHAGAPPWIRPWNRDCPVNTRPSNVVTGRKYSGVNITILWSAAASKGYLSDRWLTFSQAKKIGAKVRQGQQSTTAIFFRTLQIPQKNQDGLPEFDENGLAVTQTIKLMKGFNLFNVEQCTDIPPKYLEENDASNESLPWLLHQDAENFVVNTKATIRHQGTSALYIPEGDYILMPPRSAFSATEGYYSTIMHELVHWSGHKTRLNRVGISKDVQEGSYKYAYEELIAEIGSAYLCAELGIQGEMRHEGYVLAWIRILENDPNSIFRASAEAWQATCYLMELAGRPLIDHKLESASGLSDISVSNS